MPNLPDNATEDELRQLYAKASRGLDRIARVLAGVSNRPATITLDRYGWCVMDEHAGHELEFKEVEAEAVLWCCNCSKTIAKVYGK